MHEKYTLLTFLWLILYYYYYQNLLSGKYRFIIHVQKNCFESLFIGFSYNFKQRNIEKTFSNIFLMLFFIV